MGIIDHEVYFKINLSYTNREIREAFSAELTKLRNFVKEQNIYGFKRLEKGGYTKIEASVNQPRIDELKLWSEIYELKYFSDKKLTHAEIAEIMMKRHNGVTFDEKKISLNIAILRSNFPSLKRR